MTPGKREERPARVGIYLRVSTEEQAINGVSMDAQKERAEAYALAKDWKVVETFRDDGISGKTLERPGLSALREAVKRRQVDVVLIYSLSRLTRSVKGLGILLEEFERKGARLASVSEGIDSTNPAGVLVLNILGAVSQWEREENGRRTSAALAHKKAHGQVYSGEPPLGFAKVGSTLQPIPPELDTVRLVFKLKDEEKKSLRAIAQALTEAGRPTKRGGEWGSETVRKVLANRDLYAQVLGGKP